MRQPDENQITLPIVFVSGDKGICEYIKGINGNIHVVGLNEGIGGSVDIDKTAVFVRNV